MLFSLYSLSIGLGAASVVMAAPQTYAGGFGGSTTTGSNTTESRPQESTCTNARNMCVSAIRDGNIVQYTLSSQGTTAPGWMGIGFGTAMGNAPMVILWSNPDGTITLSQRSATGFVPPTVATSPPRVASLVATASTTSGSHNYIFIVPAESARNQQLILAYGAENPGSASADAPIDKHTDTGRGYLNVSGEPSNAGQPVIRGNIAVKGSADMLIPSLMGAVGFFAYML